jgi:hypothetical protein
MINILERLGFRREEGPRPTHLKISVLYVKGNKKENLDFMSHINNETYPKGAFNNPVEIKGSLSLKEIDVYCPAGFYEELKSSSSELTLELTIIVNGQTITPSSECEIVHFDRDDMRIIFNPPIEIPKGNVEIIIKIYRQ